MEMFGKINKDKLGGNGALGEILGAACARYGVSNSKFSSQIVSLDSQLHR